MERETIDPKALEDTMLKALPKLFPNLLGTTSNPRAEFYDKFQRVADDHDHDFIKKYDEDLSTTLIFAGLFSAVTSAFIIDVQSKMEPDYQEMNHALLKIVASAALGNIPTGPDAAFPQWTGPDPAIVRVQAILYSSLSASLLGAFIAMLGKQWLNRYASVERGSIVERGRQRKRKMDGMVTWRFALVMECLPLMLQTALLLLGCALSDYLFFMNKVVASVVIGFTSFGLLFYLLVISAATLSYNCPFQTPLSLIIRSLILFDSEHKKYLERSRERFGRTIQKCLERSREWFGRIFSRKKERPIPNPDEPYGLGTINTLSPTISCLPTSPNLVPPLFNNRARLYMTGPPDQPPLFLNQEIDRDDDALDSNCLAYMFETPMDMDVTTAIARFIPEITWHAGIRVTPLERLYNKFLECFDCSSGRLIVKPAFRDMTYLSAKALLHIVIQRKCISYESDVATFKSLSSRHQILGSGHYKGDSDLESTFGIIDRIFSDDFEPMHWQDFSFTIPHHVWMGRILLYRAWDVIRKGEPLPDDIKEFVIHSLQLEPPPPASIVAKCLLIVGLVLGIELHIDDLLVVGKNRGVDPQISRIYDKLTETFRNPTPDEIDRALEATELIASFPRNDVAQKSYHLFHIVMQSPVFLAYSQEKVREACRYTVHGAYKWDKFLPWVENPQDILTFLGHHFDLATRGDQNQDEPIHDALRALAYASGPVTIEALKRFDPTGPSFVRGICYVFQDDKPFQLRKAALFFLPLIGDRWFNTRYPIMEPDQTRSLCVDWASAVDSIEPTPDVRGAALAVLFGMINSPHWRPHIVAEKWELLEYFTSVPDDSVPLRRCIDNPELMDAIRNVGYPGAMVNWLAILWLKYKELIPEVQEQLETVTKDVAQGRRRTDVDMYLTVMDSELRKAEGALTQYNTWSTDPAAIALRAKIDKLQQARVALVAIKGG